MKKEISSQQLKSLSWPKRNLPLLTSLIFFVLLSFLTVFSLFFLAKKINQSLSFLNRNCKEVHFQIEEIKQFEEKFQNYRQ